MNDDIEDTMIHDKIITLLGSQKKHNEILTWDIEKEKTGELTAHINEEDSHHISNERYHICDDIQRNDDENKHKLL